MDGSAPERPPGRRTMRTPGRAAILAASCYALIGVISAGRLLLSPAHRLLADNPHDQELMQWWLAWGAHAVAGLHNPFLAPAHNAPFGLNAMVNTSLLLPGGLLSPVTLLAGPGATFAVLVALAPALTGWTTYLTLRRFGAGAPAGFLGGLLAALAPGLHSQGLSHLHMALAFLIPLILGDLVALATGAGSPQRSPRFLGIRLGLLGTAQLLIGAEWLVVAAVAAVGIVAAIVWTDPERGAVLRRVGRGACFAAGVAGPLCALPLWYAFAGPQHATGSPFDDAFYVADLKAFVVPSRLLLAGSAASDQKAVGLPGGITEQTSYLGWVFLVWLAVVTALLWRQRIVRVALFASGVVVLCALGPYLTIGARRTSVVLPWANLGQLPVLDQGLPVRLSLVIPLLLAPVVAVVVQRWGTTAWVLTGLVLLTLLPRPFATVDAPPAPAVFDRQLIPAGRTLVTVPIVDPLNTSPLRWEAERRLPHRLAGVFGINPDAEGRALLRPAVTPLTRALADVAAGGLTEVDDLTRQASRQELARLDACGVVAVPDPLQSRYVAFLTAVLGPPSITGDAPTWLLCPAN